MTSFLWKILNILFFQPIYGQKIAYQEHENHD